MVSDADKRGDETVRGKGITSYLYDSGLIHESGQENLTLVACR